MIFIVSITILVAGFYAGLMLYFEKGWSRLTEVNTQHNYRHRVFVSVVIPFRNEAPHIENLFEDLRNQTFSAHHLEVIMVDDHSSDPGPEKFTTLQKEIPWLKLIRSLKYGKKAALQQGISSATGELIITTDADCRFGKNWLQTISEAYVQSSADMIVMPVEMKTNQGFLSKFQQLDYLALQMVTAGAFGRGKPILCSGANLAFKKKSYLEAIQSTPGQNYLSGDDVFLLQAFKKQAFKIKYLKSAQSMVHTYPASTLKEFLFQRMRWGGKTPGYQDRFAIETALIVFASNVWTAALLLLSVFYSPAIPFWAALIIIKTSTDWKFLNAGKRFFSVQIKPFHFLMFSIVYPFYISVAGTGSLFLKERWKARKGK